MKLPKWIDKRSTQEWIMIAAIAMLLIMIATRWGYTTHTAGEAFRQRFTPQAEQTDSATAVNAAPAADSISATETPAADTTAAGSASPAAE